MSPPDDSCPSPADKATSSPSGRAIPGSLPEEPVFAEPWEAHAFGLTETLRERGLFTSAEWSVALSSALEAQETARSGTDYYRRWLAALEALLTERGIVVAAELEATSAAWERAAHATPHGQPIRLENDPSKRVAD